MSSWLSKFLGTAPQKTTSTTGLDASSQSYVDQMRAAAQKAAGGIAGGSYFGGPTSTFMAGINGLQNPTAGMGDFMDPYQKDVIGGVQADFDRQRAAAMTGANAGATQSGALGGSRQAVLQALSQKDINQNEAATLAGLRSSGWNNALNSSFQRAGGLLNAGVTQGQLEDQVRQNPIYAAQAAQGLLSGGMGPTGSVSTQTMPGQSGLSAIGQIGAIASAAASRGMSASPAMLGQQPKFNLGASAPGISNWQPGQSAFQGYNLGFNGQPGQPRTYNLGFNGAGAGGYF